VSSAIFIGLSCVFPLHRKVVIPTTRIIPPTPHVSSRIVDASDGDDSDHLVMQTASGLPHDLTRTPSPHESQPRTTTITPEAAAEPIGSPHQGSTSKRKQDAQNLSDEPCEELREEDLIHGGRISEETFKVLNSAYQKLDRIIVDLVEQTGLPEKQVLLLWEKRTKLTGSRFHSWNAYTNYFKNHQDEELRRVF
jgi:hypothetical protein